MERIETVVIGGGQAGLAMSFHLAQRRVEHVVLERGRIAERWRSQRWDSLMFQFPNWSIELPGLRLDAADPDAFSHKDEIVRFIERYCDLIRAPVRFNSEVISLRHSGTPRGYEIETRSVLLAARNVVVATGPYQRARLPACRGDFPSRLVQVHAGDYRRPQDLPPGAVLVVGSGASGCQIADELLEAGRRTLFSIGRHRRVPRRYRGHDVFWWRRETGELDRSVDTVAPEHRLPPPLVTGVRGGYDVDLRRSAERGMELFGHLRGVEGEIVTFAPDLEHYLLAGDRTYVDFTATVDAFVERAGLDVPMQPVKSTGRSQQALSTCEQVDLRRSGVNSVIWATGYDFNFDWIDLPVLDSRGRPVQYRGAAKVAGLYFLGLPWLHKAKSSFLYGVGEDAEHIAALIARG